MNVQGEEVKKLDVFANNQFMGYCVTGSVAPAWEVRSWMMWWFLTTRSSNQSKYVCLFDPLDGSSNIDVNVSIGTIFSVQA